MTSPTEPSKPKPELTSAHPTMTPTHPYRSIPPDVHDLDLKAIREDFPALDQKVHGKPLVFLDSAASAQKPRQVIDEVARFDREDYANIHRGVYALSERATAAYEGAREKVRRHLNARSTREVVFTSGTTASLNLIAQAWGRSHVGAGDEVIVTWLEHHSNIVPWQMLCDAAGAKLQAVPIDDAGELVLDEFKALLNERTRLVAVSHQSNALGTINPIHTIVELAHAAGAVVVVDGAQAVPHQHVDVQLLGCDFYAFSGHKVYGPSGIGVLYGREELLREMPPWQGGGEMIATVTFDRTTYNELPHKFEAGTPNITAAVGLGAALDYVEELGLDSIAKHEATLLAYATAELEKLGHVRIIGKARQKASVVSFVIDGLPGLHPHDIGTMLDRRGVAVRVGHHCAQPVMDRYGVAATVRASIGLYNTREDVDALVAGVREIIAGWQSQPSDGEVLQGLPELYREQIMEHAGRPRNQRAVAAPDRRADGVNPLCGDQVRVYLKLDGDELRDVAFEGKGCAICMASTSMMTQVVKGKTAAEAEALFERFHALVTAQPGADADSLGKLKVFAGVSEFPVRVKCASLAWHTLHAALAGDGGGAVTTEDA